MKIGLISLGCPKNLVDSEVMLGLAHQAGHELTQDPGTADVLVVNTCAFIDSAKRESIDAILEMAQHKKDGSCSRLIVTGCLAERYRDELRAEIPEIDAVLGTGEVPEIVRAITGGARVTAAAAAGASPLTFFKSNGTSPQTPMLASSTEQAPSPTNDQRLWPTTDQRSTTDQRPATDQRPTADHRPTADQRPWPTTKDQRPLPTYLYDADTPRVFATPRHYAYLKIAEGCDYKCAFCIIPTLRGAYRSRTSESIVKEARDLAARGIKELLLISQDTTFYGVDRHERGALARLLRQLNEVDGLQWIRLLYLYPTTIDDATLSAMAECDKVCNYIDLPLQHAADPVLKRMKRPGTRKHYDQLLNRIRDRVPGVALRTTFIVGFPGETDADVEALSGFVNDHRFDHVGVFTYSHEEGTTAHDLVDDVPAAQKSARRRQIMSLQKRLISKKNRGRIGERARIVVDGPAAEHDLVLRGRLATQAPDIDAVVYLTECDPSAYRAGDFAEVEIVGAKDYDLLARPLGFNVV